jgi:hypothetical protein
MRIAHVAGANAGRITYFTIDEHGVIISVIYDSSFWKVNNEA